jgi:gamma-glutamylcyclotransferase (GGCT)/AIG2-like uncharacterized protein YtfP
VRVLYFAYGSNLWRQQMKRRCPGYREIGAGRLSGWRWIITTRGYASIVLSENDYVLGIVYELTEIDEQNMDRFEGVDQGSYRKEILDIEVLGSVMSCLVYIDPVTEEGPSKEEYIDRINNGIRDAGFPVDYVERFLRPFIPQ